MIVVAAIPYLFASIIIFYSLDTMNISDDRALSLSYLVKLFGSKGMKVVISQILVSSFTLDFSYGLSNYFRPAIRLNFWDNITPMI